MQVILLKRNGFQFRLVLFLNIVRTIPDLLLAAIFVAVFGIGQIPGVLALFILTICVIAKLLYEALETIDPGPMEAMTAVGANKTEMDCLRRCATNIINFLLICVVRF